MSSNNHSFKELVRFQYFEKVLVRAILLDNENIAETGMSDFVETAWHYLKEYTTERAQGLTESYLYSVKSPIWEPYKLDLNQFESINQIYGAIVTCGSYGDLMFSVAGGAALEMLRLAEDDKFIEDTAIICEIAKSNACYGNFYKITDRLATCVSSENGGHILEERARRLFDTVFVKESDRDRAVLSAMGATLVSLAVSKKDSTHHQRDVDLLIDALRRRPEISPVMVSQAIFETDKQISAIQAHRSYRQFKQAIPFR